MRKLAVLMLPLLLSGCTFISFPIVPDPVQASFPVLPKTDGLVLQDTTLFLKVSIPSGEGYLGVIWYQQDKELGRESVYIDAQVPEVTFKKTIDPKLPHRAILLYQQKIIRQYEYTPPPAPKPETPPAEQNPEAPNPTVPPEGTNDPAP